MIKRNQRILNVINLLVDALLTFISFPISRYIRFTLLGGVENETIQNEFLFPIAIVYSCFIVLVYYCFRLYRSQRFKDVGSDCLLVVAVNFGCTLFLMATLFLFKSVEFSRVMLLYLWLISSGFILLKRILLKLVLSKMRKNGYNLKHVLIVGNGRLAKNCIQDIENNPRFGLHVLGYVSGVEKPELGKPLGRYEELEDLLEKHNVDELVVALEPHETAFMKDIIAAADKEGVRVNLVPFYNDYFPSHPVIEVIGETKLIDLRSNPLDNLLLAAVKRTMDIIGSLVLIVVTSPIMLVTAIGVKLSSPGPVFFNHVRVGKGKKPFTMYKFRSMRIDTDHAGWTTDADPRKTKFGSFIRKFSIDELPQFFNVLKGDMSLIGPRPELPKFVQQFKEEIPLYLVRQEVRPGITGWAQVNGYRGDTSIEKRVLYDIWYIENWSLWLDLKILFMTAFGGFMNNEKIK